MTPKQIKDAIDASPELTALAAQGATQAIADILSVNLKRFRKTEIGIGTILAAFKGLGGQFMDTLVMIGQSNRDIYWLIEGTIKRGVLDTGDVETRLGLQGLIAQPALAPFVPGMNALLGLGEESYKITAPEVESAIAPPPPSVWTGSVLESGLKNGMVYARIEYRSNIPGSMPRIEEPFGDDLTPARVEQIIEARCKSLQKADAALALFGG
jgi:hypothetical protein